MQENEVKAPEPQVTKSPEPEQKEALDRTEGSASKADMPAGSGGNGRPKIPSEPASKGVAEGRHARKCNICNHSDRAAIEFDFINWRNPAELVKSFQLRDLSTIYRHAHATGLFARRRLNLRGLMERIAERVSEVPITAAAIIRAARAIAHINDAGEWIDPPTRIIVTHVHTEAVGASSSSSARQARRGTVPGIAGRDASAVHTGSDKTRRHKGVRLSLATRHSSLTTAFDDVMLDEPSPEAASCGERPRVDPKSKSPYPTEVVLEIDPVLYEAGQARRRRAEAACLAQDAKLGAAEEAAFPEQSPNLRSGTKVTVAPWKTVPPGVYDPFSRGTRIGQPVVDAEGVSGQAPCPEPARQGGGTRTGQPVDDAKGARGTGSQPVELNSLKSVAAPSSNEQTVASSSSSLAPARLGEEAAVNHSAPSAHPTTSCKGTASAVPSATAGNPSLLPQAAVPSTASSALSSHEPRTTEHLPPSATFIARAGSAGSSDPPCPFAPSPKLYKKGGRRHF